jgi:hypothetical protein
MKKILSVFLSPFICWHCGKINGHYLFILLLVTGALSATTLLWRSAYYDDRNIVTFSYHKDNPAMKGFSPLARFENMVDDYFRQKARKPEIYIEDLKTGKVEKVL